VESDPNLICTYVRTNPLGLSPAGYGYGAARDEGETTMVAKLLARWVVMVLAVPLIAAVIRWLSRALEERGGPTRTSRLLRQTADALRREPGHPGGRAGGRW
jgi:hypothetical protein